MDLEQLLAGLSKQLEQSWVIYLTSGETLKYLEAVTGIAGAAATDTTAKEAMRDDPLMQLRLRHKASQSGSRSHIKRIRLSLDKLIGKDEGRDFVKEAKAAAKKEIEKNNAVEVLRQEVDEMKAGFAHGNDAGNNDSILTPDLSDNNAMTGDDDCQYEDAVDGLLPNEISSNRALIHRVLVTDPADFDKLSWDGVDPIPDISPEQFMSFFLPSTHPEDMNNQADLQMRIAMNMKIAFFKAIAQEMLTENYVPVRDLLKDLHNKMRLLLPNRQDLHFHVNDDVIGYSSCTSDVIRVLIRSGYLLANYLESPSRAESTRELLTCLEAFNSRFRDMDCTLLPIPYGIETEHLFTVASIAFVLQKAELCQMDVSNFKFVQLAPYIQSVGNQYERSHLKKTYGDFGAGSIKKLQQMLPSTHNWVKETLGLFANIDNISPQSSLEQKMDFIKGRGFVDGILFTKNELALPELFSLDIEDIHSIRNEARCCVIASALCLHACNIVGSTALKTEDRVEGNALMTSLRKNHFTRDDLESEVISALTSFTKALAERNLTKEEGDTLKNHALAVLRGNDPVLKLLDNRIRSYFRFACRWTQAAKSSGVPGPVEMKTGRDIVKGGDASVGRSKVVSSKAEFCLQANKEAKKLGFAFVSSDLIEAGNKARLIISLVCSNYDRDILGRLLMTEE